MEELNKALDEVISCIMDSLEYKSCISLKEKMEKNQKLKSLIDDVKRLQKEYIRSNYGEIEKEKLDEANNKLMSIPIYSVYLEKLSKVNEKIDFVKDELNDYFYKQLNS